MKEFAAKNGINILELEQKDTDTPRRIRSQKKRMPGGEISVPSNPAPSLPP